MAYVLPLTFIFLWASAFSTGSVVTQDATPFAALAFRFLLVTIGFIIIILVLGEKLRYVKGLHHCLITGLLFHGMYLGGIFYSVSVGTPAAISALIVCLQPIFTALLAGCLLNEHINFRHWSGLVLGLAGTALVLGLDTEELMSTAGMVANIVALIGITVGTIWQKRFSNEIPLATNNGIQALTACVFHCILMWLFESPKIEFTFRFSIAMTWQVIAISFGAFSILMYLINRHSTIQIASLFYLVPPVAAVISLILLDEVLTPLDIIGFLVASFGVYLATRTNEVPVELSK